MRYNDFLGVENIKTEFKMVSIHWNENYSYEECLNFLRFGVWMFNDSIINTLEKYIKKYLPKYIVSFTHRLTRADNSSLYIGVDDDGYIRGFPYKGKLDINFLNNVVQDVIDRLLYSYDIRVLSKIKRNLDVKLIKIFYDKNAKTNIPDQYGEYVKINKCKSESINHKTNIKNRWNNCMKKQTESLYVILNRERNDFIDYLKDDSFDMKSKYKHTYSHLFYLCDVPSYYDMITELRTKEFKHIGKGKLRHYKSISSCEKLDVSHHEINNIIIFYTLGRYKDYCVDTIKKFKPLKCKERISPDYPKFLLSQIRNMIPTWMTKNNDMNLYILKIDIPSGVLEEDEEILYYNEKKRKLESCYRSLSNNGPITITV